MTDLPKLPDVHWAVNYCGPLPEGAFTASQMLDLQRATLEWAAQRCEEKMRNSAVSFGYRHGAESCAQAIREGLK